MRATTLRGGIKYRPFNGSWLRPYLAGGIFGRSSNIEYETENDPGIAGAGSQYINDENDVLALGYYADAGFDIVIMAVGLRIGIRHQNGLAEELKALASQKMTFSETFGSFGLLADF